MFKNIRIPVALAAVFVAATSALAQPAPKVVTVDRARAYREYYKTEEYGKKLQARQTEGQNEINQQQVRLKDIVDQARKLEEDAEKPALTKEARDRILADRDRLVQKFQSDREALEQYVQNLETTLQQQSNINRTMMLEEIDKVVNEIGKGKGANIILDVSDGTVVYADPAFDITLAVITEINKNRPPPAPAAAPATP